MQRFISIFAMVLLLCSSVFSQEKAKGMCGDKALVASVHLFSDVAVNDFQGGLGLRLYLLNSLSMRGTFGGTVVAGNGETDRTLGFSAALLADIWGNPKANLYVGPTLFYSHTGTDQDQYTYGAVVGGEYYPSFLEPISLAWEYPLTISANPTAGTTTYSFGKTSGIIIAHLWL